MHHAEVQARLAWAAVNEEHTLLQVSLTGFEASKQVKEITWYIRGQLLSTSLLFVWLRNTVREIRHITVMLPGAEQRITSDLPCRGIC